MRWRGTTSGVAAAGLLVATMLAAVVLGCIPNPPTGTRVAPPAEPASASAAPEMGEPLGCERTKSGACLPGCEELFGQDDAGAAPPCEAR